MLYPVKLAIIQDQLSLFIPDPGQVRPVYEQQLLTDPATSFPFWAKIWPSALALTSFLKSEPAMVAGKRVLEIGAGIGLPSFIIADVASSVIISDYAMEAVELMEKNIQYLGHSNVKAMYLDWNHFPDQVKADVVLLSDTNYAPDQFGPLLLLIRRFLKEGSTIIIATPQRIMGIPFVEQLSQFITNVVVEKIREQETEVAVSILTLQHLLVEGNDSR